MNHDIKCMRRAYHEFQENPNMVGYEMTVTLNQSKYNNWRQAEKNSLDQLIKTVEQSEPEQFMIFQEHHENGWTHFHGSVWWNSHRSSNVCLLAKLNKKFGRSYLTPSKDGKIPETVIKKYDNWFEYCIKEYDMDINNHYLSDLEYSCTCKIKGVTTWFKISR